VLSHCSGTEDLGLLLGSWTWVASATGDTVSLAVMARGSAARQIRSRKRVSDLLASVLVLEDVCPEDVPAIYGGAEAFLFAGRDCSGEALRRALAGGLAVVGTETVETARVVGAAGYLVPGSDARLLGAACLTVLVEPEVSGRLRGEASARGAPFVADAPLEILLSHLERIASTTRAVDLR
jgi:glycosyltransferase involved in cell wall biosynthesis